MTPLPSLGGSPSKHLTRRGVYREIYWIEAGERKRKIFNAIEKYRQDPLGWLLFKKGLDQPLGVSRVPPPSFTLTKWIDLVSVFASPRDTRMVVPSEAYFPSDFPNFSLPSYASRSPTLLFPFHRSYVSLFRQSSSFVIDARRRILSLFAREHSSEPMAVLPLFSRAPGFDIRNYSVSRSFERRRALGNF